MSDKLDDEWANYYQNLIGVLRWAVELGQIDIHVEVSLLSHYLAMPRKGHLEHVCHIFAYLKKYNRSKIVFDDMACDWKQKFIAQDWRDFYPDSKEDIPLDMPKALGNSVQINKFVDADHAGNKVTRTIVLCEK